MATEEKRTKNDALTVRITSRFSAADYEKIKRLMDSYGYRSMSAFMRDCCLRKKLSPRKVNVTVTDEVLRSRMDQMIYQIRKIGTNYNSVVSTYMRQAKLTKADGTPLIAGYQVEKNMEKLMVMTESLRDEVAVIIDIFKQYTLND